LWSGCSRLGHCATCTDRDARHGLIALGLVGRDRYPPPNAGLDAATDVAQHRQERPYRGRREPASPERHETGQLGGFGANHRLRQSLMFLNVPTMQQPEAYIGGADKLFDVEGRLVVDGTRAFVERYMNAFAEWVARFPRD
jgi:chromate reductase